MRVYDPRLGRFLSIDPLTGTFAMLSPFQFASNSPIASIDLDGGEQVWYFKAKLGVYGPTVAKIVNGTEDGVVSSVKSTWNFITRDAWKGETWREVGSFLNEAAMDMSMVKVQETPRIDAAVANFKADVINGDAYTRSKWVAGLETDVLLGYVGDKGISKIKGLGVLAASSKALNGTWVSESIAGWSKKALSYQEFVTGVKPGTAYQLNDVRFDGIRGNTLIEAQSSYDNFVNRNGEFYNWFKGQDGLLDQARRQLDAAEGAPIEWHFSSQKTMDATRKLFSDNSIEGITLKHTPQQ